MGERIRGDVHADENRFSPIDHDERISHVGILQSQAFHLRADEHDASFVRIDNRVVVARLTVLRNHFALGLVGHLAAQIIHGIHRGAPLSSLKMQMRPGRESRAADVADDRRATHRTTNRDVDGALMGVQRR